MKNVTNFRKQLSVFLFKSSPTGNGYETITDIKFDEKTGHWIEKVEKVHLYKLIQECEGTCSMDFVIAEMKKGNYDVLNKTDGKFMDVTKLPQNIFELQEFEKKTLSFYNSNPYLKRIFKDAGAYRDALSHNVDIEKLIIGEYRKDMICLEAKKAVQVNKNAEKVVAKEGK